MLLLGAVNFEVTHSTVSTWAYLACAYVFRAHREPGMAAGPTRGRLSWKWDAWLLHLLNQGQLAPSGTLQCLPPGNVAVFHFVNMQLCRLGWHFVFGEEKRNVAEWVWCVWVTVTKFPWCSYGNCEQGVDLSVTSVCPSRLKISEVTSPVWSIWHYFFT